MSSRGDSIDRNSNIAKTIKEREREHEERKRNEMVR